MIFRECRMEMNQSPSPPESLIYIFGLYGLSLPLSFKSPTKLKEPETERLLVSSVPDLRSRLRCS